MHIRTANRADWAEWQRMRRLLWPWYEDHEREMEGYLAAAGGAKAVFVAERAGGGLAGFLEAGTRNYAEGCEGGPVGMWRGGSSTRTSGGKG